MAALKRARPTILPRGTPRRKPRRGITYCNSDACTGTGSCPACRRLYMAAYHAANPGWNRAESPEHWRAANRILARWRRGSEEMRPCEVPGCTCPGRTQPFFADPERHPDLYEWMCPRHRKLAIRGDL